MQPQVCKHSTCSSSSGCHRIILYIVLKGDRSNGVSTETNENWLNSSLLCPVVVIILAGILMTADL